MNIEFFELTIISANLVFPKPRLMQTQKINVRAKRQLSFLLKNFLRETLNLTYTDMNETIISRKFPLVNIFLKKKYNFFDFLSIFLQVLLSKLAIQLPAGMFCENNFLIYILMKEKFSKNKRWIRFRMGKNVFLLTLGCVHRIFNRKIFVLFSYFYENFTQMTVFCKNNRIFMNLFAFLVIIKFPYILIYIRE